MRSICLVLLSIAVLGMCIACAETKRVSKGTVWIVAHDCEEPLKVAAGDVIEVWTQPLPVIPENLETRFRASREGRGVELVGETLPHKEGTMERLFFFKAFDPGPATLKVELLDAKGEVRETRTYQVEVTAGGEQCD